MDAKAIELLNKVGWRKYSEESNKLHLLELISDGEDKGDCLLCHQLIWGPTYICKKEDCGFLLHKSCLEQPHPQDMKHKHDLSERNHMLFIEKLENEEKIICSFCEEVVLVSAYKCSIPNCNFLLHQSCVNLPIYLEGKQHPAHSHDLVLRRSLEGQLCDLCSKPCNKRSYQCVPCNFAIHIKCASSGLMSVANCNPHEFFAMPKDKGQLLCQACGRQNDEIVYLCRNYQLLIHWRCAKTYQGSIKIKECDHFLTLIYSLPPEKHECRVCKSLMDNKYVAYICQICDYIAHLWCAYSILDSMEYKIERLQEIENPFSHPKHKLILSNEQPKYDQHCMVCMDHIISPPFYSCTPCKFFLHERCGKLPQNIKVFFDDQETLALLPRIFARSSIVQDCYTCGRTSSSFIYCHDNYDNLILDIQCALLQKDLKHEGHQHRLFIGKSVERNCNSCDKKYGMYFRCILCNFNLCCKCVTYPIQTRHSDHEHLLKLTYNAEDNSGKYYCHICEQERDPILWFYYCQECDFVAHLDCVYLKDRFIAI